MLGLFKNFVLISDSKDFFTQKMQISAEIQILNFVHISANLHPIQPFNY